MLLTNLAARLWILTILLMSLRMCGFHTVQQYSKIGTMKDLIITRIFDERGAPFQISMQETQSHICFFEIFEMYSAHCNFSLIVIHKYVADVTCFIVLIFM